MSDDPFLAKLKAKAQDASPAEPSEPATADVPPPAAERRKQPRPSRSTREASTQPRHSHRDRRAIAFWQNEVASTHIRRLITGDEALSATSFFTGLLDDSHRGGTGLSLRGGDPTLEIDLLHNRACRTMTILDTSSEQLDYARARIPEDLHREVQYERGEPFGYTPPQPLALVVANSALHHFTDPTALIARLAEWLAPGGMVYVDEFVGPDRFQWTDAQLEIVNQLRLPAGRAAPRPVR